MREAFLVGGPKHGDRLSVEDGTSRIVFQAPPPAYALERLSRTDPDAPVPLQEHRYDYHGTRLQDWTCVFEYEGLYPAPPEESE